MIHPENGTNIETVDLQSLYPEIEAIFGQTFGYIQHVDPFDSTSLTTSFILRDYFSNHPTFGTITKRFVIDSFPPSPFFHKRKKLHLLTIPVDYIPEGGLEKVMSLIDTTHDILENQIKQLCTTSPVLVATFDYMNQIKAAGLALANPSQAKIVGRNPTDTEFARNTTRYYAGLTGTSDTSLAALTNPQGSDHHYNALHRARGSASAAPIYDKNDEEQENRTIDQIISEAQTHLGQRLQSVFIEMIESGEEFQYRDLDNNKLFYISKNDISRLTFLKPTDNNKNRLIVFLDGKSIELITKDAPNMYLTYEMLQAYFSTSTALRKAYWNTPEKYLEMAVEFHTNKHLDEWLENLEDSLQTSSLNPIPFFTNGDWDAQYRPWNGLLSRQYNFGNQLTMDAIAQWLAFDSLANPRQNIYESLEVLWNQEKSANLEVSNSNPSKDNEKTRKDLVDNLRLLNLIPDSLTLNSTTDNGMLSAEGYERSLKQVHYLVEGESSLLEQIDELSSLPEGTLDNLCSTYRESSPRKSSTLRLSSAMPVRPSTFAGSSAPNALRLATPPHSDLHSIIIRDDLGNTIPRTDYKLAFNKYSGHYVVVFKEKAQLGKNYTYDLQLTPGKISTRDITINRKSIDLTAIHKRLKSINWESGADEIRRLSNEQRRYISLNEIGRLLSENMDYGLVPEGMQKFNFTPEGKLITQCTLARDALQDVLAGTEGIETFPLKIATKLDSNHLKDQGIALFRQNHTALLVLKKPKGLRRTQVAVYDITPTGENEEIQHIEAQTKEYLDKVTLATLKKDTPLPTPYVESQRKNEFVHKNNEEKVKALKNNIYSVVKQEEKIPDDILENLIKNPKEVELENITGATPLSRLLSILHLYHSYIQSNFVNKDILHQAQAILDMLKKDEELYVKYANTKDKNFRKKARKYFGKYIKSSPLVFTTARQLESLISEQQ